MANNVELNSVWSQLQAKAVVSARLLKSGLIKPPPNCLLLKVKITHQSDLEIVKL